MTQFISKRKYRCEWANTMRHKITSKPSDKYTGTELSLWTSNQRLNAPSERFHQSFFDLHTPWEQATLNSNFPGGAPNVLVNPSNARKASELRWSMQDKNAKNPRRNVHEIFKSTLDTLDVHVPQKTTKYVKDAMPAWQREEANCRFAERDIEPPAVRMSDTSPESSECKQIEKKSARLQNLHMMAYRANQAFVRLHDSDRLLSEVCRIAVECAGFDMAWVGLINQRQNKLLPAAMCRSKKISNENSASVAKSIEEPHEASIGALKENRAHIYNGSLGIFPLRLSGQSIGALNLHAPAADFFDADVIGLLTEIANNLSFALDSFEREAQRKQREAALAEREKFNSAMLSAVPDSIVTIGQHGEIISFNRAAELAFAYQCEEVLGKNFLDALIASESRDEVQRDINHFFTGAESPTSIHRIESKAIRSGSGAVFPIELTIVPLIHQNEPCLAAFIRDISREKRAEALQLEQNRILHLIATGVMLREILIEITRFAEKQSDGRLCTILQLNDTGGKFVGEGAARCDLTLKHGLKTCSSWPIFGKDGKTLGTFTLHLPDTTEPTPDDHQVARICSKLAGIAIESRTSEERIRYLAHYDGLTSLPNRFLFEEYLDVALHHAQRAGNKFALLFVDLDKFKEINDTLGHEAGDQVLREIGTRMRNCLRHTDKIARMGGDEFYVLIEDLNESHYAADIAQKLLQEIVRPVVIRGKECYVSASIGISLYPDDGDSSQALLHNADKAMYRVKNVGKNGYQFFSSNDPHQLPQ
ncbi:MAG TPA: diguanylate cyclase [Noviherbaspirillum sp.]|nr:diguanylate cyclase [Noviherbaspirillum sp.]